MRDANIEDHDGKNSEEAQLHDSTYRIIDQPPEGFDDKIADAGLFFYSDVNTEAKAHNPANEPPAPQPVSHAPLTKRLRGFAKNQTKFYATLLVGLGILIGVIFAVISLFPGTPVGLSDLGPVISTVTGLKGHLYLNWEKTLQYGLTFEASDSTQQAGFAFAVANSPRPLSIEIQLQDAKGLVLCSREIVLKFDARNAVAAAANPPNKPPTAIDIAQWDVAEQKREQGKDIFQNQYAPDGQVASINAHGEIPCSARAYEKTTQWSFSTNFPSLLEQDEWLERRQKYLASMAQRSATHQRAAVKAGAKLLPFSIEGDDMIVEFDVNTGVIITNGRNTFFFDKTSAGSTNPAWQEYPVNIHFRCDQNSDCIVMHAGAGALRAKLKR